MLRNRITAKISRDRKKKEYEQLTEISKNLMNENYMLNQELDKKDREILFYKNSTGSLCDNCRDILNKTNTFSESTKTIFSMNDLSEEGRSNFGNYLKYSVYASFLVVMCIIGAFSFPIISPEATSMATNTISNLNNMEHTNQRMLLSLPVNNEIITSHNKTKILNKTSTDLVLMEKLIQIYKPNEYIQIYKPNEYYKSLSSKPNNKIESPKILNEFLGYFS